MFHKFFPKKLKTPHIKLGIELREAIDILRSVDSHIFEESGREDLYRINTADFDMAIYPHGNIVKSVWIDDSAGRLLAAGKFKKIQMYLDRYSSLNNWELRLDNGLMQYWFNDVDKMQMVYGLHKDVIRFNQYSNNDKE